MASRQSEGVRNGLRDGTRDCTKWETSRGGLREGFSRSWLIEALECVARSRQVRLYVVEALLIAIYLPKKKGVYMYIRPTLLPEATLSARACPAEPTAASG